MKKCTFYTLARIFGEIQAVSVKGWAFNGFFFYTNKNPYNCLVSGRKKWFAIIPEYGVSIGSFNRLQDAILATFDADLMEKVTSKKREHGTWYRQKFLEYLMKAGVNV